MERLRCPTRRTSRRRSGRSPRRRRGCRARPGRSAVVGQACRCRRRRGGVVAALALDLRIVPGPAVDRVGAAAALELVRALAAVDHLGVLAAAHDVVPRAGADRHRARDLAAVDDVVAVRDLDHDAARLWRADDRGEALAVGGRAEPGVVVEGGEVVELDHVRLVGAHAERDPVLLAGCGADDELAALGGDRRGLGGAGAGCEHAAGQGQGEETGSGSHAAMVRDRRARGIGGFPRQPPSAAPVESLPGDRRWPGARSDRQDQGPPVAPQRQEDRGGDEARPPDHARLAGARLVLEPLRLEHESSSSRHSSRTAGSTPSRAASPTRRPSSTRGSPARSAAAPPTGATCG